MMLETNERAPLYAIDLFCGSGGVTLGLKNAGFQVVGALDFDPKVCDTYAANHPEVHLVRDDIRKITPDVFESVIDHPLALMAICAPCQPFSSQNRKRDEKDHRSELILETIPFVKRFKPAMIFVENVPGLRNNKVFSRFRAKLRKEHYDVSDPVRLDAADLGVPQRRIRMVMVAAKGVNLEDAIAIADVARISVREAIGNLPTPPTGPRKDADDPMHVARRHSELNIRRMTHIPLNGGGRSSLPEELVLNCHKSRKASSFSDTYGRMSWDDVSPTLTTGCTDITRGRFIHPEQHRAITTREAARLQSFPDSYVFLGNQGEVSAQIGNAVPPRMMEVIAKNMIRALLGSLDVNPAS